MANKFGGRKMWKNWSQLDAAQADFTTTGTSLLAGLGNGPFTVLRMIGEYTIDSTAAPVVNDRCTISCGIGVVSNDAFVLGATAMPDPGDEGSFPWLFWASHRLIFRTTSLDPSSRAASVRQGFDVKSMRRIAPNETLAFIADYEDTAGTPPVTFACANTRVLIGTG